MCAHLQTRNQSSSSSSSRPSVASGFRRIPGPTRRRLVVTLGPRGVFNEDDRTRMSNLTEVECRYSSASRRVKRRVSHSYSPWLPPRRICGVCAVSVTLTDRFFVNLSSTWSSYRERRLYMWHKTFVRSTNFSSASVYYNFLGKFIEKYNMDIFFLMALLPYVK